VTRAFTLETFAATLLLIGLIVMLPTVLQFIGLGTAAQWAARIGGLVLMVLLMIAGLAALYRVGPSRQAAQWRWITPGAILAIIVILVTSGIFTWYVAFFGSYDATYGSLGAVFGFMGLGSGSPRSSSSSGPSSIRRSNIRPYAIPRQEGRVRWVREVP
jgi:membrane protein